MKQGRRTSEGEEDCAQRNARSYVRTPESVREMCNRLFPGNYRLSMHTWSSGHLTALIISFSVRTTIPIPS